jgi:HD-GYP domain-containing protein (c-di-GMP phosphodiesterase class II)
MDAKLIPVVGVEGTEVVPLQPEQPVVLGRGDVCTVRLSHSKVSRLHCRISYENGFYTVEDLDSKNGTWVNNRRIHKAILFHHDRITVGGAEFRFVLEGSLTEESTNILLDSNGSPRFETEIREPAKSHTPSSLFIDMPKVRDGSVEEALERDLSAVCKVINSVNAEYHLDRLFATIMDSVMEVTDADRGYLIAAKKLNGVLMPLVSRNKEGIPTVARNTFSRSIVAECYETGDSILRSDPTNHLDASESIVAQQIQSIICVPMRDEQGTVGVIYIDNVVGSNQFTKRDLKVLSAIGNQAGIAIRRAQLQQQVEKLFSDAIDVFVSVVEGRDPRTHLHSKRVTAVALRISSLVTEGRPEPTVMHIAGMLHDLGKLTVRLDVLEKPESLTDAEYDAVKKHPGAGAAILSGIDNADPIAAAIRHHHERWDGTGYPDGLAGEDIPLAARILAIAEAFDSMATDLPYRAVLPPEDILAELTEGAGTQFDPHLVGLFVEALQTNEVFMASIRDIYRPEGGGAHLETPFL